MSAKFDIRQIVTDHVRTLRDQGSVNVQVEDKLVFFAFPLLAAVLYFFFAGPAPVGRETKVDEVLVAAFAIFAALLLNIQVFLLGTDLHKESNGPADEKAAGPEDVALKKRQTELRDRFLQELFANISYAILISSTLVVITLVSIFLYIDQWRLIKAAQFFFVLHFALTLFMIMKRIHVLFAALRRGN